MKAQILKVLYLRKIIILFFLLIVTGIAFSADYPDHYTDDFKQFLDSAPPPFRNMFIKRSIPANYNATTKSLKSFTPNDWALAIDTMWGNTIPVGTNMNVFNHFWMKIDKEYPNFHSLDPNIWTDVITKYWSEIMSNPSDGRFCAIMEYTSLELNDGHTWIQDQVVSTSERLPGVPLLNTYTNGWNYFFGAGLTPLPDSSLLVYDSYDPHPLGIVPGDIVLGYDGIPWKDIYPTLLEAQLPMNNGVSRGAEGVFTHSMLQIAGCNWYLFDTIDIVKYDSGDTLHLPTSLIIGAEMPIFTTEQLVIPGIPRIARINNQEVV